MTCELCDNPVLRKGRCQTHYTHCEHGHDVRVVGRHKSGACKACAVEKNRKLYRQRRALIDAYKLERGCWVCGYNKSAAALHLHHEDPDTKTISRSSDFIQVSLDRFYEEAKKCIVLCANCHMEFHYDE